MFSLSITLYAETYKQQPTLWWSIPQTQLNWYNSNVYKMLSKNAPILLMIPLLTRFTQLVPSRNCAFSYIYLFGLSANTLQANNLLQISKLTYECECI